MRKQDGQQADPALLAKVESEFAVYRQNRSGSRERCSDDLRRLAFSAMDSGHSIDAVVAAAGMSRSAISRWQREGGAREVKVRKLRVVREPRPVGAESQGHAIVRMGVNVAIELPVSALTDTMLRSLSAAAGVAP